MKYTHALLSGALAASLVSTAVLAADASAPAMPDDQKKQVEKVVHDYLVSNPEVLLEASQALQQKQQQNMQQQAQSAIMENAPQLFEGKLSVAGNPKGGVTVVEFFDYQCIHCKKMSPTLANLIKENKNLRVVYKEFPIFGKSSEAASRAALAAGMQGKYQAMHDALFNLDKRVNDKAIMNTAKNLGLNISKFKADMDSKEVTAILDANRQLAEKLHLMGTPAFIIASTPDGQLKPNTQPAFIPGAASEKTLKELIKKASE